MSLHPGLRLCFLVGAFGAGGASAVLGQNFPEQETDRIQVPSSLAGQGEEMVAVDLSGEGIEDVVARVADRLVVFVNPDVSNRVLDVGFDSKGLAEADGVVYFTNAFGLCALTVDFQQSPPLFGYNLLDAHSAWVQADELCPADFDGDGTHESIVGRTASETEVVVRQGTVTTTFPPPVLPLYSLDVGVVREIGGALVRRIAIAAGDDFGLVDAAGVGSWTTLLAPPPGHPEHLVSGVFDEVIGTSRFAWTTYDAALGNVVYVLSMDSDPQSPHHEPTELVIVGVGELEGITTPDVTDDGRDELAIVLRTPDTVTHRGIAINTRGGQQTTGFNAPLEVLNVSTAQSANADPSGIAVIDANNDGRLSAMSFDGAGDGATRAALLVHDYVGKPAPFEAVKPINAHELFDMSLIRADCSLPGPVLPPEFNRFELLYSIQADLQTDAPILWTQPTYVSLPAAPGAFVLDVPTHAFLGASVLNVLVRLVDYNDQLQQVAAVGPHTLFAFTTSSSLFVELAAESGSQAFAWSNEYFLGGGKTTGGGGGRPKTIPPQ